MENKYLNYLIHETKNFLQNILPTLELLDIEKTEKNKRLLNLINISIKKNNEFLENSIEFARIDNEIININMKEINLKNALDISINSYKIISDQKKITINFKYPDKDIIVKADGEKLLQVFNNLLSNAIKFTHKNGYIGIDLTDDKIIFKDNGKGIDKNYINKIFESYETTDKKGLGIGLYISKKIIDLHKWKIEVNSSINNGTKFTISF